MRARCGRVGYQPDGLAFEPEPDPAFELEFASEPELAPELAPEPEPSELESPELELVFDPEFVLFVVLLEVLFADSSLFVVLVLELE